MKWRSTVLLLALLGLAAAVLVKSESNIEVDENGDEYEVKRFNIQGRQLDGGRSQCVVTRRKRAVSTAATGPMADGYGGDDASSADDTEPEEAGKQPNLQDFVTSQTTPATGVDTGTGVDKEDDEEAAGDNGADDGDDNDDVVDDPLGNLEYDEEEEEESPAGGASPANGAGAEEDIPKDESDYTDNGTTAATGTVSPSSSAAVGSLAALAAAGPETTNGLVVVHGSDVAPPIVNGQTHAVFQIVPAGVADAGNSGVGVYVGDGEDLHYEEEISPISTTAIWSTGDDQPLQYSDGGGGDGKPAKKPSKGGKGQKGKNKKKKQKQPKNKNRKGIKRRGDRNKRRRGNKNRRPMANKRRGGNKNKTKRRNSSRRRNKRKPARLVKRRKSSPKRRYPNSDSSSSSSSSDTRPYKRRNKQQSNVRSTNRRTNANLLNTNRQLGDRRNRFNVDKGTRTYTNTETETATGTANDQRDVNCIFIRKDPPPTQRPFWGLLGRDAGAHNAAASGHFGKRKRVNMRFAAPQS